ncbi:conserved phage C-terminal domain-containing protein, partial [Clostridium sp. Sa3CUN1]
MQFSFLGYSVKKIMELNLDVKDITILRYFDDFRKSGKMNYEEIEGVKYYWISYQNIENELPFLGLGKRSIMIRMLKLRDLGILSHYTKKEGGTFSFYALGDKYKELLSSNINNEYENNNSNIDKNINNNTTKNKFENLMDENIINEEISDKYDFLNSTEDILNKEGKYNNYNFESQLTKNSVDNKVEAVLNNEEAVDELSILYANNHKKEEGLFKNSNRGCAKECTTKTNILNNSSTIVNNIYNNIKISVSSILNYLNSKVGVMYKPSNTKTISLIKARLREGFTFDDFKSVIDKKFEAWKGTSFEQYLTPFTLFGDKFEIYLNQKIVKVEDKNNNSYGDNKLYRNSYGKSKSLRFHNFKGRDYDYDDLEKKLLG